MPCFPGEWSTPTWLWSSPTSSTASAWPSGRPWPPKGPRWGKRQVVENDPTEQGERAVLNLGHTIGHAIEKLKNFELLHGQCVALGTVAAAYISYKRSYLSDEEFYEIRDMNVGFYLPITVDGLKSEDILAATKSDKKMEQGTIKFILLESVGHAVVDRTVTDEEMLEAINSINGDLIDEE